MVKRNFGTLVLGSDLDPVILETKLVKLLLLDAAKCNIANISTLTANFNSFFFFSNKITLDFFLPFSSSKRIISRGILTGAGGSSGPLLSGRYCPSYEVSPSSFRYYSSSVEYLTGIWGNTQSMPPSPTSCLLSCMLLCCTMT